MQSYRAFSRVERGHRHVKSGTVCQDFALATDASPGCSVIVVADGHGGADYYRSDRGARFIVQATAAALMEFGAEAQVSQLRDLGERRALLRALFEKILAKWKESIEADLFDDPIAESQMEGVSQAARQQYLEGQGVERAYGTTMIAALVTEKYWIGLHQGDGRCIAVRTDGSCEQPIPWDERCVANITTSICDENAADEFRHCFSETPPAAVFLCSDGVEGAYPDMDGTYGFCQTLSSIYLSDGRPGLERAVAEYLPELSRRGTGDDVTVAGLLCVDKLEPIDEVLHIEEHLRKSTVLWEQASRDVKAHEHEQSQVKIALEENRAEVSHLEKLIAQHQEEVDQMHERIRQLEEEVENKTADLDGLRVLLKEAQGQGKEIEEKDGWMDAEHKRLHTRMEETAAEVERLMDEVEQARERVVQKRRESGQPPETENYGEDFTEPWAFVNR
ncbi:MAG: protein phosphatase 2C domain-containing protein [Clostridiaceae bacterium]|nr:protein phosphatase 2C domain-containing protein [Clostridiaceae bacterium]